MATPLQYFQQSPVRGQLEPPDSTTRPGWRYLQCTETPNELKGMKFLTILLATTDPGSPVLLPPRASQVYAYLLSQEQVELTRGAEASWERLMHVRHLKDRMIREHYKHPSIYLNLNHQQQGNAGALLASPLGLSRPRINSVLSTHLQILPSRYVRSRNESKQSSPKSSFRNSRNGIETDMTQTASRHPSAKRVVNHTRASTLTVLGGRAEGIVPLARHSAVGPLNPDSAMQKTAIIQTKRNGPTSRMTIRRKPCHRFPGTLSSISNTKTHCRAEIHTSQTQISTIPAPMCFPLIQYPCPTDPEKLHSLSYTNSSPAIFLILTLKSRPSTSYRQAHLP